METYELFGEHTSYEVFDAFKKLYELASEYDMGKLTDLQKEVLSGMSLDMTYVSLQKDLGKKHIASIQAPMKGGIKNILHAVMDVVWLFNNPQLLEWLNVNAEKKVESDLNG